MPIHGLKPHLAEIGKIKIGGSKPGKGGKGKQAIKYDYFKVTTTARGEDGFEIDPIVHEHFGPRPTKLDVILLSEDIEENLSTYLACYDGSRCFCRSDDGLTATWFDNSHGTLVRREVPHCPCTIMERDLSEDRKRLLHPSDRVADPKKGFICKPNGVLKVVPVQLDKDDDGRIRIRPFHIGGVHVFRTTGINSISQLLEGMSMVKGFVGILSRVVPLKLSVRPKTVRDPSAGRPRTVYVVDLGIEFAKDEDMTSYLERIATDAERLRALQQQIAAPGLPAGPRVSIPAIGEEPLEEQAEHAAEFYPADPEYVADAEAETAPTVDDYATDPPAPEGAASQESPRDQESPCDAGSASVPATSESPGDCDPPPPDDGDAPPADPPSEEPTTEEAAEDAAEGPAVSPAPKAEGKPAPTHGPNEGQGAPRGLPRVILEPPKGATDELASPDRRKALIAISRDLNYHDKDVRAWMGQVFGATTTQQLKAWQAQRLIDALEADRQRRKRRH